MPGAGVLGTGDADRQVLGKVEQQRGTHQQEHQAHNYRKASRWLGTPRPRG